MKKRLRAGWMLGTLCALAVSMQTQAAELSDLAPDAAIIQGTLDNGVRYALWPGEIKNDTYSIALVRKDSLCFIEEISKARKESSPDSVFFRAFRETQDAIAAAPEACGTDNSLLFVVGDFNKDDILSRMRHLSVMLPAHTSSWKRAERDAWQESAPALSVQPLGDGFALLEYSLWTKAIEEKYLSTIVPAVSERSWAMLSRILDRRMETTLRQRDIAFNGLQVLYRPAAGTETSNRFTIRLNVDATDGTAASQALCDVLEDLRTGGSTHQEIESAARHYLIGRQNRQMRAVSDKEKIRRLFSAYLYHTDLAPEEVKTQFFASRKYKAGEDKQRFDRFAARTLRLPAGHQAQKGASVPPKLNFSDTLAFPNPAGRIKLSRSVKEGTSGGSFLFFENGTTAVYKKMPCGGRVYFSFIFDGGNSRLRHPEASAYVEDMFYAGSVNGYPVKDFLSLLAASETDIRLRCGFSALVLEGSCRQDKLSSLLKALVTLTGHFKVNEKDIDYPLECEKIPFRPGTGEKAQNEIAGILHPEFGWHADKTAVKADRQLLTDAAQLLRNSFRSCQNGTLVLEGNIPERRLNRKLRSFMGMFPTDSRGKSRNYATMLTLAGTLRVGRLSPGRELFIASSFDCPAGMDQMLRRDIALSMAREKLSAALGEGNVQLFTRRTIHPKENLDIAIYLPRADEQQLRTCLDIIGRMASGAISEDAFRRAVAGYEAAVKIQETSPFYWKELILNRLVYGKDYRNNLQGRLEKLTTEDIRAFFRQWVGAGRVEYVAE